MNQNRIITDRWSNDVSEQLYRAQWPEELAVRAQYEDGLQCGGCSFFAPFNADYGLCCNAASRHHTETVFEHFTCPSFVNEGWEAHSFQDAASKHFLDGRRELWEDRSI
jgi:hypothetical protein